MATIPIYKVVDMSWFDHIKIDHTNWDGRCPLEDDIEELNNGCLIDLESEHLSWLLSQILDAPGLAGTREIVSIRRKLMLMEEFVYNTSDEPHTTCRGGSYGDGFSMKGGDVDSMIIDPQVIVTYHEEYHLLPEDSRHKTVLFMRESDCQPGYVALELGSPEQRCSPFLHNAAVPVGDAIFVSSDMFRQGWSEEVTGIRGLDCVSHGPCSTVNIENLGVDFAFSFPCTCWPKEAEEWVYRTRLYGWPTQDLRDKIVQSGCHLVPVGDRCSSDTFLQWRISFLTAERTLIHSLSHQQFRIYGLLKYFLKQIKGLLENLIFDSDILCSYFIKTLIFHAVENSPTSLWQEKHTFVCFRFCLRILIDWIKNGNCPNYFIKNNNMFKRKIHGETQHKLLHVLTDMYHIKLASLSVGIFYPASIWQCVYQAVHGQLSDVLPSRGEGECDRDIDIFKRVVFSASIGYTTKLKSPLKLLSESQSDTDEFIAYNVTVETLANMAITTETDHTIPGSNKQKYRELRKCKRFLTPKAAMCPGRMDLATFHYNTGNYRKTLEMCGEVLSYPRLFIGPGSEYRNKDRYQHLYCGRGYSFYHKLKDGCTGHAVFHTDNTSWCLPHLHLELAKSQLPWLNIPPLPYAVFLSFLCYHDLGDTRRRDAALLHIRAVNHDPEQGGHKHWIVHTLLGICYQTVGDTRMAIRSYTESLHVQYRGNPAKERIEVVRCSE